MIESKIIGGAKGVGAIVTRRGQLVVGPVAYSKFYFQNAAVVNTAYNLVKPFPSKKFVITDIILSADRSVSATNGAVIDIYEATSTTSTVVVKQIYEDEITKLGRAVITGLNIIVTEGYWVNVKTDDNSVRCNLGGYYIPSYGLLDNSENETEI